MDDEQFDESLWGVFKSIGCRFWLSILVLLVLGLSLAVWLHLDNRRREIEWIRGVVREEVTRQAEAQQKGNP